jgi:hypothetical protein
MAYTQREAQSQHAGTGYGGKMTDTDVRNATKALEHAIIALQRRLGLNTFCYNESTSDEY